MANYNEVKDFLFILIGADVVFGIILFVLKRSDMDGRYTFALLGATLYSIFWEVITAFLF